jgi:DNA-binding IclR family transcriptional regulator
MTSDDTVATPDEGGDRYTVPALERGLRILGEFGHDTRTLSAPELARRFDLPRSTMFRLLTTLENMGFLERAEGGRDYRLGLAVLRLGFDYLASLELTELGTPVLNRLSEEIGHICHLVVRDGRSIVYVAKTAIYSPFRSTVSVGTRLPAHATVLGHALLADMTLPELRTLYPEDKLEQFTSQTPANVHALFDAVHAGRERGYVISEGFYEPNISTVATPVRDRAGHVVAALGVRVNAAQIDAAERQHLVERACSAADEISALLYGVRTASAPKVVALRRRQGD